MLHITHRPATRMPEALPGPRIVCLRRDYPDGGTVDPHCHAHAQLIYATAGLMEIRAGRDLWIVPPQRALWMPAGIDHALRARGAVSLRTAYIAERAILSHLPPAPTSLTATPLLRELLVRAVEDAEALDVRRGDAAQDDGGCRARLLLVLLDEIARLPHSQLRLPMPSDPRLARICDMVLAHPEDRRPLAALAASAGASVRTLARLADREFGVPFSVWRQQARMLAALPALAGGRSVTETALAFGYGTPSAFASVFRRVVGTPPRACRPSGTEAIPARDQAAVRRSTSRARKALPIGMIESSKL